MWIWILLSAVAFSGFRECLGGSAGIRSRRESLRYQVSMLRAEQNRDRERIETLEKNLFVAREERNAVSPVVPEWLGDLLEELSQEIGEVAAELRQRGRLEEMLEALQVRQEKGTANLRRLAATVEILQKQHKNIPSRNIACNETEHQKTEIQDPWNEEGSGDLEESALMPAGIPKRVSKDEFEAMKTHVEKHLQDFKHNQNTKLQRLENHMEGRLNAVKDALDKVQAGKNASIEDCRKLVVNITGDFRMSITQVKDVTANLSDVWQQVSKVEFNAAQYQAALDVLQRDWSVDNKKIKELQTIMENTQRILRNQSHQILSLELETTNMSLQRCHRDGEVTQHQVRLNNMEMRLAQTNLRLDSWSRQSDIYRNSAKTALYTLQETISNTSGNVENVKNELHEYRNFLNRFIHKLPKDCSTTHQSGLVLIQINSQPAEVYCETKVDGRSWLVTQRRMDGSVNFFRNWTEYKLGFGNPTEDFWIGNEILHHLTAGSDMVLHIDMWDLFGRYWYVEYDRFHVKGESEMYSLELGDYSGNATDSFGHHAGMGFSTYDKDNDASSAHCAVHHTGGWWYQHCHRVDLNGRYPLGLTWYDETSHDWLQLQHVEMKIAPFFRKQNKG